MSLLRNKVQAPFGDGAVAVKKVNDFPVPSRDVTNLTNSLWPGIIKLFPARENLVSDILARVGKIGNLFSQCTSSTVR
jgi:hypothetical protein